MKSVERYIELALKVAANGEHQSYKVGAVLVNKGQPISLGYNSFKTHPLMSYKTLHAEVAALVGVRYRALQGSTIYVARTNKNGKIGLSKPCPICQKVLVKYGITKAYYTLSNGDVEILRLKDN